jgi:hypothetical protein
MRHSALLLSISLLVVATLAGCARKSTETETTTTSESLFVANPSERLVGDLTPTTPPEQPPPPATAREPKHGAVREPTAQLAPEPPAVPTGGAAQAPEGPAINVMWGTTLRVTFAAEVSSETVSPGDAWTGTLRDSVAMNGRVAFPAGSVVHGTVKEAMPALKGDRARLGLEVTSIEAGGRSWPVRATTEPIVAGSPRARNLGAIIGGAAVGAVIGHAVGGEKGGLVGGLAGGAAAGGAVVKSKGYEVVIKPGTTLPFSVAEDVIVRP